MGSCCLNLARALALFLGFVTLALACVSFGTNYWLEFDVDRSLLTNDQLFVSTFNEDLGRVTFNRHRGIFRECYSDDDVPFLDHTDDEVDSDCFELDFDDPDHLDVSDDYSTRIHLLRCVVAFFTVGIVFGIATIVVAIVSICRRTMKWIVLSMLSAFFTGLFVATATAFFLGVDYMEREDRGDSGELVFRKNWAPELEEATSTSFAWSFALSWVAVGLALVSAALYLVICLNMRSRDDGSSDSSSESDASSKPSVDQKVAGAYLYHHPYAINEAYHGKLNPVYWPYDNTRSKPSRGAAPALQVAVPSDYSGEIARGSQYSGSFYYGHPGALLPSVSYMQSPDQPISRTRRL